MAQLIWNVQNAVSVNITPGIGTVAAAGSRTVNPTVATTYTLTATDRRGRQTVATVVIGPAAVGSPVAPPVSGPVGSPVAPPVSPPSAVGTPAVPPVGSPVGSPVG